MKDLKLDKESLTVLKENQLEDQFGAGEDTGEESLGSCKRKSCDLGIEIEEV